MRNYYGDILERIPTPPLWFDENGVPRYVKFHPDHCSNIYACQVLLVLIQCQNCQHPFYVCMSRGRLDPPFDPRFISYGDPPNIGCCASGLSMCSDTVKVVENWTRDRYDWVEHQEFNVTPSM